MRTATEWLSWIGSSECLSFLQRIYGNYEPLIEERRSEYQKILHAFSNAYGEHANAVIARAPGRINLMGRHVDHRGGHVNPIGLNLEIIVVAQPRTDDRIVARNLEVDLFPESEFDISSESPSIPLHSVDEWDKWTLERSRERDRDGTTKRWINYIKAGSAYFQNRYALSGEKGVLRGMNLMVSGNIPRSAGLGSSSALFVGCAEALLQINRFPFDGHAFVEHCGWGEWYVGTRGGMGDHAAIKLARAGHISHIGFWPFSVKHFLFPKGYHVVIANSGQEAHKASNARDRFNQCVACYEIGLLLMEQLTPEIAARVKRLRDLNPAHLSMSDSDIHEALLKLPERATRPELLTMLPATSHETLNRIFARHAEPEKGYAIRDVCLFGVGECERSRRSLQVLSEGDVAEFGELMRISHHGDRVAPPQSSQSIPTSPHDPAEIWEEYPVDPTRNHMPLFMQPGAYGCSTPQIDRMVDIAMEVEGVVGAQISGAGLGGCIMALASRPAVEKLREKLSVEYYKPIGLKPDIHSCVPVEGAGIIEV